MSGLVWRFGGFEYSPNNGLQRDGVQVAVGPQARQLLELLLESKGSVVSKAEIASRLWPGRPPSDDSIDRCAYLLRRPLREAGGGDLIATSYGRGLSLRAKVEILNPNAKAPRPRQPNVDGRVLDLWQIAYELAGTRSRDGFERAQKAVDAVIDLDPDAPAVRALSADIAIGRTIYGFLDPMQALSIIGRDAGHAISMLSDFPAALAALGWSRVTIAGRAQDGMEMLDRAIQLDESYSKARVYRSWCLVDQGRLDEAIADLDVGLRLSPFDQGLLGMRAWLEICRGDVANGEKLARQGLELRPGAIGLAVAASIATSLNGHVRDAEELIHAHLQPDTTHPLVMSVLAYIQAKGGMIAQAEESLAAAGTPKPGPCIYVAAATLALGRVEEAKRLMESKRADGCPWFAFAAYDPRLAPIHDDISRIRTEISPSEG